MVDLAMVMEEATDMDTRFFMVNVRLPVVTAYEPLGIRKVEFDEQLFHAQVFDKRL